ncbi:MAG: hypothetical protein JJT94_13515 [Bernardetiaceae bacterium]|nr:hypothetical protein [Bernardetiaceae bacterium]
MSKLKLLTYCLLLLGVTACYNLSEEVVPGKPTEFEPLYITRSALNSSIQKKPAQPLKKPGKIYVRDPYLFINEQLKGVHIFDNRNPRSPRPLAFIEVPGCVDMAVKNNILYVDNVVDLVAIDITNPEQPREVHRIAEAFPQANRLFPPDGLYYEHDSTKGYIVEWIPKND